MNGTRGNVSEGSPCGSVPTISTPYLPLRSSDALNAMKPNSTTRPAGIFLEMRGSRKSSASAEAPTAKVTQFAWGSSLMIPTSFSSVLPSGLGTPNSLLSCPTATKTARPTTKPSITGLDRNWVMKPRCARPAARKIRPVTRTNAEA